MSINKEGKIDKGWGYELIFASNDLYCGKIMVFNRKGAKFSMHYHAVKDESWFINNVLKLSDPDPLMMKYLTKRLSQIGNKIHYPF